MRDMQRFAPVAPPGAFVPYAWPRNDVTNGSLWVISG